MSRGKAVSLIVAGFLLIAAYPTTSGFWHAYRDKSKVLIGMNVADVFRAVDDWDLCLSTYRNETTKEFGMFNVLKGDQVYRIPKYDKTFTSKEDFVQFVAHEMSNGQAWGSQLTYFAGAIRNTFRVDFDPNGKVRNVAGMVVRP